MRENLRDFLRDSIKDLSYPELAKIASGIPKLLNPQGQILGLIQSSFINEIQNSAPELLKVTNSYNQIQNYIQQGAKILSKEGMKVNDKGVIVEGSMEFSENQQNIGNLISEKFKPEDISLKNMKFEKKDGLTTFTFKEDGSLKLTKQVKDNTGKLQKVPVIYNNLEKDSAITIDENGEIVKAKINSKNPGSFENTSVTILNPLLSLKEFLHRALISIFPLSSVAPANATSAPSLTSTDAALGSNAPTSVVTIMWLCEL